MAKTIGAALEMFVVLTIFIFVKEEHLLILDPFDRTKNP